MNPLMELTTSGGLTKGRTIQGYGGRFREMLLSFHSMTMVRGSKQTSRERIRDMKRIKWYTAFVLVCPFVFSEVSTALKSL